MQVIESHSCYIFIWMCVQLHHSLQQAQKRTGQALNMEEISVRLAGLRGTVVAMPGLQTDSVGPVCLFCVYLGSFHKDFSSLLRKEAVFSNLFACLFDCFDHYIYKIVSNSFWWPKITSRWILTQIWSLFNIYLGVVQGGPEKTGPVWALITQRWLPVERRVIWQKFWSVVDKKCRTCIANHLNILCLICLNLHHPWN